jgi:hypothetical protein
MSCQQFEEWLALDVGGDLAAGESTKLQAHLSQCEVCSRFAEELRASQVSLRALHGAALRDDLLAAVRNAVLDEVRRAPVPTTQSWGGLSSPTWLQPRWALAGFAVALVVAFAFVSLNVSNSVEESSIVVSIPAAEDAPSDVRRYTKEPAVEARAIETAATQREEPVRLPNDPEIGPEVANLAAAERAGSKQAESAVSAGIEVVSMPDTEADDPDANPDVVLRLATNNPNITIYWLVGQNGD